MTGVQPTEIDGCVVVSLHSSTDARGSFARAFSGRELAAEGIILDVVQANVARTARAGTVRGLHYQAAPHGEQKLLRCVRGAVFDVVVDLRSDSPTYGLWTGVELTEENGLAILVPRGCAHGYQALVDDSQVLYFVDAEYAPEAERVLSAVHETIGVQWPLTPREMSDKDAAASMVDEPASSGY